MRELLGDVKDDMRYNVYAKTYIKLMPGILILVLSGLESMYCQGELLLTSDAFDRQVCAFLMLLMFKWAVSHLWFTHKQSRL